MPSSLRGLEARSLERLDRVLACAEVNAVHRVAPAVVAPGPLLLARQPGLVALHLEVVRADDRHEHAEAVLLRLGARLGRRLLRGHYVVHLLRERVDLL